MNHVAFVGFPELDFAFNSQPSPLLSLSGSAAECCHVAGTAGWPRSGHEGPEVSGLHPQLPRLHGFGRRCRYTTGSRGGSPMLRLSFQCLHFDDRDFRSKGIAVRRWFTGRTIFHWGQRGRKETPCFHNIPKLWTIPKACWLPHE